MKKYLFNAFFVACTVGFVPPLFGAASSSSSSEGGESATVHETHLSRPELQADWDKLYSSVENKYDEALKTAHTDVFLSNPSAYAAEVLYSTQDGNIHLITIPVSGRVYLGNSSNLKPIIGVRTVSYTPLGGLIFSSDFAPFQLNSHFESLGIKPNQNATVTLKGKKGWTSLGWDIELTAEDVSDEALKTVSSRIVISNPTGWSAEIHYSTQDDPTPRIITVPSGGEVYFDSSSNLKPIIRIKTIPRTSETLGHIAYGSGIQLFQLNDYFKDLDISPGQDAIITLKSKEGLASFGWDIDVSTQRPSDRKIGFEVVNAFRSYAEHNAFNYKELFKDDALKSTFVLNNNSYWPIDVVFFRDGQAFKVSVEKGNNVSLGTDISKYIAIKARPLTTEYVAGLFNVQYQYRLIDLTKIENMGVWFTPESTTFINITTAGTTQDWTASIHNLTEKTVDLSDALQTPISINWPPKLGWSQKRYVTFGHRLNDAILSKNEAAILALGTLFKETFPEGTEQHMVKALIIYYHALAQQLGHIFQEGTFIIHGGQPIYAFLQQLDNKYNRDSSHLNALAKFHERPWLAQLGKQHFGYDTAMPEINFSTILFNRVSEDGDTFYLKPESHGTAGIADIVAHGASFVHAQGRKLLPAVFGSDDQAGYSKERIPKDILKRYLALIEHKGLTEGDKQTLAENAVSLGIQAMYKGAKQLLERNPENAELAQFIRDLETPDIKKTYPELRIGSEAILTPAEFAMPITRETAQPAEDRGASSSSSSSSAIE